MNEYTVTLIHPAPDNLIQKYWSSTTHFLKETKEKYQTVTKPFIDQTPENRIKWVYNILNRSSVNETYLYENSDPKQGFVLVTDLKFIEGKPETLYLIAISHDKTLKSLRDLDGSHLELLEDIRRKGYEEI